VAGWCIIVLWVVGMTVSEFAPAFTRALEQRVLRACEAAEGLYRRNRWFRYSALTVFYAGLSVFLFVAVIWSAAVFLGVGSTLVIMAWHFIDSIWRNLASFLYGVGVLLACVVSVAIVFHVAAALWTRICAALDRPAGS
jgi:hypothetical protein